MANLANMDDEQLKRVLARFSWREKLLIAQLAGWTTGEAAKFMDVRVNAVTEASSYHNIRLKGFKPRVPKLPLDKLRALAAAGKTRLEIADAMLMSPDTVMKAERRYNLNVRPRHMALDKFLLANTQQPRESS